MFEKHTDQPISRPAFLRRMAAHVLAAAAILALSVLAGMAGFVWMEKHDLPTAFLHAASVMAGMGAPETPATHAGKVFLGCYMLYSGLVFVSVTGIILAPVAHRLLHRFHGKKSE